MKWFLGRGPRPQYGRYTYWEKFDYFAVFWGMVVIGSTGLLLWFPEFFTRVLPGWSSTWRRSSTATRRCWRWRSSSRSTSSTPTSAPTSSPWTRCPVRRPDGDRPDPLFDAVRVSVGTCPRPAPGVHAGSIRGFAPEVHALHALCPTNPDISGRKRASAKACEDKARAGSSAEAYSCSTSSARALSVGLCARSRDPLRYPG